MQPEGGNSSSEVVLGAAGKHVPLNEDSSCVGPGPAHKSEPYLMLLLCVTGVLQNQTKMWMMIRDNKAFAMEV